MLYRQKDEVRRSWPMLVLLIIVGSALLIWSEPAAQGCAMCQTVMPRGDEPMARGLFWSVTLLLSAPFVVGGVIGGWLYRQYRHAKPPRQSSAVVFPLSESLPPRENES